MLLMVLRWRSQRWKERSREQSYGPCATTIHTHSMGIRDGLWRGEEGCFGPIQKDADLCGSKNGELSIECSEKNWDVDVKHVKAHRMEKETKATTAQYEFVMEGNEKANELGKDGAEADGGAMAATQAPTIKQLRNNCASS